MIANETLDIVQEYLAAGINCLPLRLDGSKAPAMNRWRHLETEMMTPADANEHWSRPAGIGFIGGRVSGGLEFLDFDEWQVFEPFKSLVRRGLMSILPVIETGSLGYHVYYRCEEIAGNTKLATLEPSVDQQRKRQRQRPASIYEPLTSEYGGDAGEFVRIETRGEGGYVVAPGSPSRVHATGNPYVQVAGPPLPAIPTITPEERRHLWSVARRFNCSIEQPASVQRAVADIKRQQWEASKPAAGSDGLTPWDDFSQRGRIEPILIAAGWERINGDGWSRPRNDGSPKLLSAKVNKSVDGCDVLVCYSTSVPSLGPLGGESHKTSSAFEVLKQLVFAGDGKAAARAVADQGFGDSSDAKRMEAAK